MNQNKRTLEHIKNCLMMEQIQNKLTLDKLVRYINGIEEFAIEYGKSLREEDVQWLPTELHITLKRSTDNHSPKNNAYKNMRG